MTLYLSRLCRWWRDHWSLFSLLSFSLTLFPRALRSLADCLAPRNASLVAGSFARPPSPCAPFPASPVPCLRSDTVWLVLWLVTALQGPCQWFVLRESAGLALFRSLTVPFAGLRPFSLPMFHPPHALGVLFVALFDLRRYSRGVTMRMRLVFRYWMDRRSCKSWCICLELGL